MMVPHLLEFALGVVRNDRTKARAHVHYYVGDWPEIDCIAVRGQPALAALHATRARAQTGTATAACRLCRDTLLCAFFGPKDLDLRISSRRRASIIPVSSAVSCFWLPDGDVHALF